MKDDKAINSRQLVQGMVKNALDMQDITDLPTMVHFFSQDIQILRTLIRDTHGIANIEKHLTRHPICVLYAERIAKLTGSEVGMRFTRAHEWCIQVNTHQREELPSLPVDAS